MLFPNIAQTIQVAGIKWFPISTSSIIRPYTKQQDRFHSPLCLDKNANTRLTCYSRKHLVTKLPNTNSQDGSTSNSEKHIWMLERHLVTSKKDKKICIRKTFLERNWSRERERVWLFAPHKAKSKKFFLPWDGPYNIIEKTSEVNYKISKDANAKKWQIVHYNRLKPVKEEDELPRMETRSSHQEKWPSRQNTNDQEVAIEVNNQTFTPEIISKRPKQESPFKWMDEDDDFFYDLFAEREHSTKRPTKTNIGAEPNTPEQATTQENQSPFVTPAKEIESTPLPQRPHKPKNVLRDLSEIQSTPASAKREMCKPKNICRTFGNQNWRNSKLHR